MSLLGDRLLAIHRAFGAAAVPHAIGGAIALGYCTQEPRGTRDLDINVFLEKARAGEAFDVLPSDITVGDGARAEAASHGQVRLWWEDTPVDLFFDDHRIQRRAATRVRVVPFEGNEIPVLACNDLALFKALYNRPRDWADLQEMLAAGSVDGSAVIEELRGALAMDDPSVVRLSGLVGGS